MEESVLEADWPDRRRSRNQSGPTVTTAS